MISAADFEDVLGLPPRGPARASTAQQANRQPLPPRAPLAPPPAVPIREPIAAGEAAG